MKQLQMVDCGMSWCVDTMAVAGGWAKKLALPLVAVTLSAGFATAQEAVEPIDINIALSSNSFATSSLRIAEFAGLFEKNGLRATVTPMESGTIAMSALVGGSADFASSNPAEIIALHARGQPVFIIAGSFRGYSPTLILAPEVAERLADKKDGTPVEKVKALDGLSIAVPSAASVYTWPLTLAGELYDVNFEYVFMQQNAMPAALQAKTVDGFVAASPFWEQTIEGGYGSIWLSGPHGDYPEEVLPTSTTGLGVMESFVEEHPEAVERVLATLRDVGTLIKEDPARAKEALAKSQPKLTEQQVSAAFELYAEAWSHPEYTLDDLKHDLEVINKAKLSNMPDLSGIDPTTLLPPQ